MAERAAAYLREHPEKTLVVLAGAGHLEYGQGIPNRVQRRIQVPAAVVLNGTRRDLDPRAADFLLFPRGVALPAAGLLGVLLDTDAKGEGVAVKGFSEDSGAKAAGMEEADRIVRVGETAIACLCGHPHRPGGQPPRAARPGGGPAQTPVRVAGSRRPGGGTALSAPRRGPELLAPAGTLKGLTYALAYGADAVYAGLPRYSLRVRNNDFDADNLAAGIAAVHAQGRRLYLACNLMPHGAKLRTFVEDLDPIVALGPDALILADPGLILLARERWPEVPIHLSVQANTLNAAAVRFWQAQGIARVILSRELSLDEIAEIRQTCPDMELEVFVHGALCIAYSGRCLLSGWFNHRDANQGSCTNACRWEYRVGWPSGRGPRRSATRRRMRSICWRRGSARGSSCPSSRMSTAPTS